VPLPGASKKEALAVRKRDAELQGRIGALQEEVAGERDAREVAEARNG
jgi:hypothetical protein